MVRRKSGRRSAEREAGMGFNQLPFGQVYSPYSPFEILSADQLEAIHQASLLVLRDTGMTFLLPEARELLKAAGADVQPGSDRVRFEPALIEALIKTAPSRFTMHSRNPAFNCEMGGNIITYGMVASPPNATDIDRGRRTGNFEDFCNFMRLAQLINVAHHVTGYPVEPIDIPVPVRHLKAYQAGVKLCEKVSFGYSHSRERILDVIEMTRIVRGISEEQMTREPSLFTVVNANSPLQYDRAMLEGIIEMAKRNQPVIVTPFTLSGAMAPVTIAGALVQQNAEALAGIAMTQVVNPGAPVLYGGFTSNVDMKTGSPAFGTPEYAKAVLVGGQLARKYGVPYRTSNVNASNAPDVQSAYESMNSLWSTMLAHGNYINHGLGWLEGGLSASFEKVIIDAEMIQNMIAFMEPLEVTEDSLAVDAINEVGPGGHFFGTAHTLARYETAFYAPMLSDWNNYENWSELGGLTATERANRIYKKLLVDYERPLMDPAIEEELDAYVDRRVAEGGAPLT
ncbi:trimethylamine methyltransferase family protein [Aestuariispira insulae]|uniref:Methyltransferase n=1 Tax=Aestuariispira insulae TaxID=1461337 RepID=A0A3D9HMY6_9PROT|nr:trimethylamine methyltransferase family protein [Aestuariispira insulae]RED50829.1 trimethylamine--corrinoid protein Co-methyltransferase [Aestuariispira insulae]